MATAAGGCFLLIAACFPALIFGLSEDARIREYHHRGHVWPPNFLPPTPGWSNLMLRREKQIMALASSQAVRRHILFLYNSASFNKHIITGIPV